MTLLIIGSADRSKPIAAVAALTAGERVLFTSDAESGAQSVSVEGRGFSGRAEVEAVPADSVTEADAYVIVGTVTELQVALGSSPTRFENKPVLLSPGGFAGSLTLAQHLREAGVTTPRVAEVPGWMIGGKEQDGDIRITMRKRQMPFAAATDEETGDLLGLFARYFPDLVASDLVATAIGNFNAIIHPPSVLYNVTRIESGEPWHLWDTGFTPAVAQLMEATDRERVEVLAALGAERISLLDLALGSYADSGMTGETFYEAVQSFDMYRNHRGPADLDGRFLTDDVPHGVAAWEQLAIELEVGHDTLTAIRVFAELLVGRDLKADPAAVHALIAYAQHRGAASETK